MEQKPWNLNPGNIEWETTMARNQMEHTQTLASGYSNDPDKKERLAEHKCRRCYYTKGRIGGSAMTDRPCGKCKTVKTFSSTATDVLCDTCAAEEKLCKQCGAKITA